MRSRNIIGLYLATVLIALMGVAAATYYSQPRDAFFRSLLYTASAGGIGGTLFCIRAYYQHLGGGTFKDEWAWWYYLRPPVSVVVGVLTLLISLAGLAGFGLGGAYEANPAAFVVAAFLAGFAFTRFASVLERLSGRLFHGG